MTKMIAEIHTAISYSQDGKGMLFEARDDISGEVLFRGYLNADQWLSFTSGGVIEVEGHRTSNLDRVGKKMIVDQVHVGYKYAADSDEANAQRDEFLSQGWDFVEQRRQNNGLKFVLRKWVNEVERSGEEDGG